MSVLTALVPLAALGLLVFLLAAFAARGRDGADLSPRPLLRAYLYVGSFAGVGALAFGLASLLTAGLALVAGNELVYGAIPEEARIRRTQELDLQRAQDALRGVTFALAGGLFWLAHWLGRNRVAPGDQGSMRRAYALLGAGVFGLAALVLLPTGISQALSFWLLPATYRPGAGGTLAGGVVAAVVWLLYLRLVLGDLPRGGARLTLGSARD
ncbi:MAG: DUF5671 domain-containing protein [Candidatus Limnocylindria bacterium]|nr:DUF5671 domain-containing protein [Candidatus Limnocylindria bacterium]